MFIEYHQSTLSFQISHKARYTDFGRYAYQHMNMIWHQMSLYNLYSFVSTQLFYNISDTFFVLIIDNFSPILRRECGTILNHTDLYEYKHGKILIHLNFCFEGFPTEETPAAMLKYYRQRKGLTTRQLAESVEVVPATVLMYERGQFPIPYQTAVAMAKVLEIDRNLLFDEFAQFLDYPYSDRLREVRNAHRLNQAAFAEKTGVSLSIYSKWEGGSRQPSRKMYQQLVTTYPEINI